MVTIYKHNDKRIYCNFIRKCYRYNFIFYFFIGDTYKSRELSYKELRFLTFENTSFLHLDFNLQVQEYFMNYDNYVAFKDEVKAKIKKQKGNKSIDIYYRFNTITKKIKFMGEYNYE